MYQPKSCISNRGNLGKVQELGKITLFAALAVNGLGCAVDSGSEDSLAPPEAVRPAYERSSSPDKSYRLNLSFRRSTVDRQDLITALQEILQQLVTEQQQDN